MVKLLTCKDCCNKFMFYTVVSLGFIIIEVVELDVTFDIFTIGRGGVQATFQPTSV